MMPPETEDNIVDVSLKHIVIGFATLIAGTALIGTSLFLVRDHLRFKRQQAFFDHFSKLLNTLTGADHGPET